MKQSSFAVFYFSIGALFIILERFLSSFYPGLIVKALIIPSLMVYFHISVRSRYHSVHRLMMFALFFSWIGDISLQLANGKSGFVNNPDQLFLAGLGAFLLTQLLYSVAFNLPKGRNTIFSSRLYQLLLVVGYGSLLMWLLYNKLVTPGANYRIPVIVYTLVILTMLVSALNRYGKVNGLSYILVVIGAILFVASDSMIAISKFLERFDFARVLIMSTYVLAQYFIVSGIIKQDQPDTNV